MPESETDSGKSQAGLTASGRVLTKGHPDLKLWLDSLSTGAVRPAEIFQCFLFLLGERVREMRDGIGTHTHPSPTSV